MYNNSAQLPELSNNTDWTYEESILDSKLEQKLYSLINNNEFPHFRDFENFLFSNNIVKQKTPLEYELGTSGNIFFETEKDHKYLSKTKLELFYEIRKIEIDAKKDAHLEEKIDLWFKFSAILGSILLLSMIYYAFL